MTDDAEGNATDQELDGGSTSTDVARSSFPQADRDAGSALREPADRVTSHGEVRLTVVKRGDQSFTRLLQASPAPFLVLTPDAPRFTIAEVSDAYLQATMRTREGIVGRGVCEAFPDNPNDATVPGVRTLRASLERVLATKQPDTLPGLRYDIARPDGTFEERWFSAVNWAALDEHGEVEALIHNAKDVTEEYRANAALRESEERYRDLFERMREGFCIIEVIFEGDKAVDYVFLDVNPAFVEQSGIENAVGRSMRDIAPDHEEHWFQNYGDIARTGRPMRFEAPAKQLGNRWYDVNAFRVGQPEQHRVAIIFTDITQRRRDAAALRESEARLANDLEATQVLQDIGNHLNSKPGVDGHFNELCEAARTLMRSDCSSIQVYDEAGSRLKLVGHVGFHPDSAAFWEWVDAGVGSACGRALASGKRVIVADMDRFEADPPDLEAYRRSAILSVQSTPLVARNGLIVGMMSTHWHRRNVPAEANYRFFDILARLAADFIVRIRAEAALRESEERHAFLVRFSDAVRGLTDPMDVATTACRMVHGRLGVDRAYWSEVDWSTREWFTVGEWRAADIAPITGRYALDDWEPGTSSLLDGQEYVVNDVQKDSRLPAAMKQTCARLQLAASLAVPVMTNGKLRSLLAVDQRTPRHWTPDEIALIESIAGRCWAAVELARAQQALRESEEKYRNLFEWMGQGYSLNEIVRDAEGAAIDLRYLELNPAFERLTGASLSEARGRLASEVFPGLDRYWVDVCDRAARTDVIERVEHELTPNGRWYQSNFYPIGRDRVLSLYDDITDRKRAEIALRASEERQAFLLKLSDALRPLADPQEVKAAAARVLGEQLGVNRAFYADVEGDDWLVVKGFEQGVPALPDSARRFGPWIMETYRSGDRFVFGDVVTDVRFAPAEREAHITASIVGAVGVPLVKDGRLVAIFAVHTVTPRDWTQAEIALVEETAERTWAAVERARAEAALRTSEEKYRTLFASMDEGYALIELERDQNGMVDDFVWLEVNPAFERHSGVSGIVGKRASELVPNIGRDMLAVNQGVADTGVPKRVETYNSDLERWFDAVHLRVGGEGSNLVGVVFSDITQRKRAAMALKASEERQAFLLALTDALRPLEAAAEIQGEATRLLREHLDAGWCYYVEWDEAAARGVVLRDATRPGLPSLVGSHDVSDVPAYLDLLRNGNVLNVGDYASFDQLTPELRARYTALGFRSMLVATLVKQGRLVASLIVGDTEVRQWPGEAEVLLTQVAERTWAAVERARAEAALRASEERQAFLLKLSDALRPLDDPTAIQAAATRLLRQQFDVGWCYYADFDETGQVATVLQDASREGLPSLAGRHDVSDVPEYVAFLRTGQLFETPDLATYPLFSPRIAERYSAMGVHALLGVPVVKDSGALSLLLMADTTPHPWPQDALFLIREVAERTWAAVKRAHAEAALRESEEKYRNLFEWMGQGYSLNEVVRDAEGAAIDLRYLELNPAFERLTGASLSEARGRLASEVFPGLDRYWVDICDRAARTGVIERVEHELTPNGRWYQSNFYPIGRDRVLSLYDDITDRKRAELALRESEERQAFLLRLSDALRAEPAADAVADRAIRMLIEHMRLDRSYIVSYRLEEDRAYLVHQRGNETAPPLPDVFILSDYPSAFRAIFDQTLVIEDELERQGLSEAERRNSGRLGMRAMVAATLRRGEGRPVWSLVAISSLPRRWTQGDIELVEEVAERTWAAMERARAVEALKQAHDSLEARVRERTAEVRTLFTRLVSAQEEERRRIARDIHDHVGQQMTALRMNIAVLGVPAEGGPASEQIKRIAALAEELDNAIDFLTWELRPAALDHLGLPGALAHLVSGWSERFGIHAEYDTFGVDGTRFAPDIETNLYRLTQEALHNVFKHAQASHVSVLLEKRDGRLALVIEDNGEGFIVGSHGNRESGSFGLLNMRERATLVGGQLTIDSTPGHGTTVIVRVPVRSDDGGPNGDPETPAR